MNENLKGYYLNKTGDRVKQLLDRQFIVPTLDNIPNTQTKTWQDGEYVVTFRIGELCRVHVNNKWEFYRLHDIVNNLCIWQKANAAEVPEIDLSDYPTRNEVQETVDQAISSIPFPEDESIKNVTEDEYNSMFEADTLSDKTMYFVSKDGLPIALYIGKVQIAVREEGSKGFAYNFPIIF